MTGVLIRDTDTHRENTIMTTEAETGVTCLQPRKTKDCWEPPGARRRQRGKEGSSSKTGVGSWEWSKHGPAETFISDFWPREL